jgi:hypothetical protein
VQITVALLLMLTDGSGATLTVYETQDVVLQDPSALT